MAKAIIVDLDGTLLHSDSSISDYTLTVLRGCKDKGIPLVVATARFWFKAEKYLDIIQPDYAILADGTQIYHGMDMICGYAMEHRQSQGLIEELRRQNAGADFVVSIGQKLLCSGQDINEVWRCSRDFSQSVDEPVYKIAAVINAPDKARALAEKFHCRLYSYRGEDLYGFASKSSGKYAALAALADILHVQMKDMVAFGDDENDYEIIKQCGTGVAVANAIPEIKEAADGITESNDRDGVARFLEREILQ